MNFTCLILLLVSHFLSGRGLLKLFGVKMDRVAIFSLSMINGVVLASLMPFLLQLFEIRITGSSVAWSLVIMTIVFCIPLVVGFKFPKDYKLKWSLHLYDYPYILICLYIIGVSIWKCFYTPVQARDMLSGPEVMAAYAIREGTMISSIFKIDLQTTNNYLKPPFITSLQIIYEMFVTTFGQLWLSVLVVSFLIWLFSIVRKHVHPVIGGFLLLFFITIPELYSYTFIMLFDYSNVIFFFVGFYLLYQYLEDKKLKTLLFSSYLFGVATYIRTETLVLVVMALPLLIIYLYREKHTVKNIIINSCILPLFSVLYYILCITIFVKHYIPVKFDVSQQVNKNLADVGKFFDRLSDMNSKLIFSDTGRILYGYFIQFFIFVLAVDLVFFRKFSKEAIVALYGVGVVYFGLPLLGYLLPLVDLPNTTKRGLFKMFPLMLLYMANSASLMRISGLISSWEYSSQNDANKPVHKPFAPAHADKAHPPSPPTGKPVPKGKRK